MLLRCCTITAREGDNLTDLKSNTMLHKAKEDTPAQDKSRIVEKLTALLERQATPDDNFCLPLAVPTYEEHTDKKSVADFLQELQDYRHAQALKNDSPATRAARRPVWLWRTLASSPVFRQLAPL
ncbi:hypothetical protein MRX96_025712 [Rhipicephalus microplus]